MPKFVDVRLATGGRLTINKSYITMVTPTHGNDFEDGGEIIFVSFGEQGLLKAVVPASQMKTVLAAIHDDDDFVDLKPVGGERMILNTEYITHVAPTHGANLADGAEVSIWGTIVQVPASGVTALSKALKISD